MGVKTANSQLGLKPRTKKRAATKAPALAAYGRCPNPKCGCSHILNTQSENGRRAGTFYCGACGFFFDEVA